MRKLLLKDKKLRTKIKNTEKKIFILKSIFKNINLFLLTRWKAFMILNKISKVNSKVRTTNRCLYTINKKRFNKLAPFSRHELLKLIRFGKISGIKKSSW